MRSSFAALTVFFSVSASLFAAQAPQTPPVPPSVSTPEAATPARVPAAGARRPGPKSPDIEAGAVTFRLLAPAAQSVGVSGSWQKTLEPPLAMTKDADGVWSLTLDTLKPDLWTYTFVVDGARMLDPGNVNVQRDGTRYLSSLLIPGESSAFEEEGDVPHGSVHEVWYPSPTLGMAQRRMYIYTPAGYEDGKAKYPVLYLLHGAGGDEDAWDNMGRAHEIMDHLIASGKAKPMLVVMTNGNWNQTAAPGVTPQAPGNGFSLPGSAAGQPLPPGQLAPIQKFSESIVNDVIPVVEKRYRVIPDRDHRAIAGLSMGGAQTLLAGLNHLDKFSYVATFSGAFVLLPGAMKRVPPPPGASLAGPGVGQALDLDAVEKTFPNLNAGANAKLHLLYLSIGLDDGLLASNQQFMDWLTSKGITYQKKLVPGYAHVWPVWRISLEDLAPQLFMKSGK